MYNLTRRVTNMLSKVKSTTHKVFGKNKINDLEEIGIGGFILGVRTNETSNFTSEAPDHYVEDGSVIHDHIINQPVLLNIEGQISDITRKPLFIPSILVKVIDKAVGIDKALYYGTKTQHAWQKINNEPKSLLRVFEGVDTAFKHADETYGALTDTRAKTHQDDFFKLMEDTFERKLLIDIEMPFKVYSNMRITSLAIVRDNTTNQALNYNLSAKEVRFAKVDEVDSDYFKARPAPNPTPSMKDKIRAKIETSGAGAKIKQTKGQVTTTLYEWFSPKDK